MNNINSEQDFDSTMKDLYVSLDYARNEISLRRKDLNLINKVKNLLGDNSIFDSEFEARSILFRPIVSPDNGWDFFIQCSNFVGLKPLGLEFLDDKFVLLNEEKKALANLNLVLENGDKQIFNLVDCNQEQGKKLIDVRIKNSDVLIRDFHHELMNFNYEVEIIDASSWFRKFKSPSEYYYYYFLNFIVGGVYFEFLNTEDKKERDFIEKSVYPNLLRIKNELGIMPLVVRLYPENQSEEEDFYWFSYRKEINDFLVNKNKIYDK